MKMANSSPAIVYYDAECIPDDRPRGPVSSEQFFTVREAIVEGCRRHGLVGPDDGGTHENFVYWVIDDQYNDERYQYLELCKPSAMNKAWLLDLMKTLEEFPDWGVGVSVERGYMLVFYDRLMINGPALKGAATIDEVIEKALYSFRFWK